MSFKYELEPGTYIARTHSAHPARNTLIKICSRNLEYGDDEFLAERCQTEKAWHESMEKDPGHRFFVIKVIEEKDDERTADVS